MDVRTSNRSHFLRNIFGGRSSLSDLVIAGLSLAATVSASAADLRTDSVESGDGVRIVYDVRGQGATTLLFVHCWAGDRFFWRDQADAFADEFRVVTLDLAGHGESGRNRKHWSILGLSEDVLAVANALKLERVILIGHSMGGPVSLEAARLLSGRVLGVVLVDTMHNVEVPRSMASAQADAEKLKTDFGGYLGDLSSVFSKTTDPSVRHWVEKKAITADPTVCIALKLDTPNLDLKKLFINAGVPIRAINAKPPIGDVTNVEGNRKYADYNAILMDNVGHFIQLERPKEFNENLSKCLAELLK